MRRFHGAGSEDHLAVAARLLGDAVLGVSHTNRTLAIEDDFGCVGVGLNAQIRTIPDGIEETARGGPARAVLLRHLIIAETFLTAVVVVVVARETFPCRGID